MKSEWRPVRVIILSLVIDLLGFTVILPLLPSMLQYYSITDKTGLYNTTLDYVDTFRKLIKAPEMERLNIVLYGGLIGSLYSLLQFFSSPLIGASSDIFGRKPILILSTVGVLVSYVLWSISYSFPLFIISRIFAGLSKGIVSVSTALVTDVTTSNDRPSAMALIGVAFSIGFIFGPLVGAYFSYFGKSTGSSTSPDFVIFQYPALFSCITGVIVLLILIFFLKETLPLHKRAKSLGAGLTSAVSLINPVSLFRFTAVTKISVSDLSNLRWMSFAYFLYLLMFSGLEQTLTFLVHQRFQYTRMQQGKMFLVIGVMMALVQGGYLRRKKAGTEKNTALTGMAVIIPGMLLIGWSSNAIMLYLGLVLYSFGAGTVVSCMTTIASRFGKEDEKGKIMGIFRSLGALSRALGPFMSCAIYWSYGACICYMVGGLSIIIPIIILAKVHIVPLKTD